MNTKISRRINLLHSRGAGVVVVLFLFLFSKSAFAQTGQKGIFSVSPAILNIQLSPGKTFTRDIRVTNLLNTPLPVRAQMDQVLEGEYTGGVSSIADWVTISESDMIIPARQDKVIRLTVQTPSQIPVGGYYGTLFLQPLSTGSARAGQLVQARAGIIILANIGVPDPSAAAEILNMKFSKEHFSFEVKNRSLYHFSAKPRIIFDPLFGDKSTREISEKIILPGKIRSWEESVDWPKSLFNIYDMQLRVSTGNGNQIVYKTSYVDAPFRELALILFISGVGLIAYNKRRNLKNAASALVSNN